MVLNWVLKYPKQVLIAVGIALIVGHLVHYKYLQGKVDRLSTEKAALSQALVLTQNELVAKDQALQIEREAVDLVAAERDRARRALDQFRADRANDPEAVEWAADQLPAGELMRICAALPELEGCN